MRKFHVGIAAKKNAARMYRNAGEKLFRNVLIGFDNSKLPNNKKHYAIFTNSALNKGVPENVKLLSLAQFNNSTNSFLIRLMHKFADGEDETLSQPVTVSLRTLFKQKIFGSLVLVDEMNVIGNEIIKQHTMSEKLIFLLNIL